MTMLTHILGLRPKPEADAASLRASLTEATAALAAARGRAATLEGQRGDMLLDGTPAAAEAHEAQLVDAKAEAGRLSAVVAALPPRITAAEARERAAELDRLAAAAEADAVEGAALLPQIVHALNAAAEMMRRHDEIVTKVRSANAELKAGGLDGIALPMRRSWPDLENKTPTTFGFDLAPAGLGSVFAPTPANSIGGVTVEGWLAAKAAEG